MTAFRDLDRDEQIAVPMAEINKVPKRWTTQPEAWAPYVGSVEYVASGDTIHVSIDMRPKYLQTVAEVDGDHLCVTFYARETEGEERIKWPAALPAWPADQPFPRLLVSLGRDLSGLQVVACDGGRYTTRVVLAPRLADDAWESAEHVEQAAQT